MVISQIWENCVTECDDVSSHARSWSFIMKPLMNMGRSSQHVVPLSPYSTPLVPNSSWAASDFLLGAGMVIIQPSSRKIVIVYDPPSKAYFLPKGRKDIGESLEQTALREAYEEVVYSFY